MKKKTEHKVMEFRDTTTHDRYIQYGGQNEMFWSHHEKQR